MTLRITPCNDRPIRPEREYVLLWMVAQRRVRWSFVMDRAVALAAELGKPLVVFEPLRCTYPWSSPRLHRFIMDGMADHEAMLADRPVTYLPYVEPEHGAGSGLLEALAARACAVVTDDWPCLFIPRMIEAAASRVDVQLERVDSNGMLPLRATERVYTTAYSFRRGLHKLLPAHLEDQPRADALDGVALPTLPAGALDEVLARWPRADEAMLAHGAVEALATLPLLCPEVEPVELVGGEIAAQAHLQKFLASGLDRYKDDRNHPEAEAASGLSPYLHFGMIATHEIFAAVMDRAGWSPDHIAEKPTGQREGWWQAGEAAEAFIDELITWREIGLNMAHHEPHALASFEAGLPDWAKQTIREHAEDDRPYVYTLETFEQARTHDPLWNAAQRQLVGEGIMHNYLRMLWGKKIVEWSASAEDAATIMIELNNKYALDGRDPNSYSGIFWCLGRYDRGWTERPIMGKLRYMTSESTRRKLRLGDYLERWGG